MSAKRSTLGASLGQKSHNVRKISIDHFDLRHSQNNQENCYLKPSVESELVTRMKKRLKSIENKLKIVQNHKFHDQKDPKPLTDKDLNITIEGDGIQNLSSIKGDTTTIPVNYREYLNQRVEQKNGHLLHDSKSETLDLSSLNEREKGSNCPNNIFFQSCTDNTGLTESNIEPCPVTQKPQKQLPKPEISLVEHFNSFEPDLNLKHSKRNLKKKLKPSNFEYLSRLKK